MCHFFHVINPIKAQIVCPNKIGPYQLRGTIGAGAFATVKLAYRADLDIYYACKIIAKQRLEEMTDKTRFEQEIRILQEMRHPRIVQLYDLYKDSINYYIMMEYCPNGELFSHIVSKKRLSESDAKIFFKHILDGIYFVHSLNIAHRDLKPENILIDAEGHAKLSDFGLSKYVGTSGMTSTSCGSPCYASPEVLSSKPYNAKQSDMWSAGVILYAMVTGQLPWTKRNHVQLFEQIKRCHYHIPPYVSGDCCNLIKSLMTLNTESRLTVEQALAHPWMAERCDEIIEWKEVPIVSLRRLDKFFEIEPSADNLKLPYRPASFGKRKRTFQKETKMLTKNTKHTAAPIDMVVKPSVSTWVQPNRVVPPCETSTLEEITTNWKDVVKKVNRKSHKIVKPKVGSVNPITNL